MYNKDLILKEFIMEKKNKRALSKHTSSELLGVIVMLLVKFLPTVLKLI